MANAAIPIAEFLKAAERFALVEDATTKMRWGDDALDASQSSCLATEAAATTEVTRQLALTKLPRADDVAIVAGVYADLEGETVSIPYNGRLGMAGDVAFLVVSCKPDRATGQTTLQGQVLL